MNPVRIVFLRSHSNAEASALIVQGLQENPRVEFKQYPPLPEEFRKKVKSDHEWALLQEQQIETRQELRERIENKEFDLAILADKNSWLFEFGKLRRIKKLERLFQLLKRGVSEARIQYRYVTSVPFSEEEFCRRIPFVVADLDDIPYLKPGKLEILRQCLVYFKREIPYNRFALYHPFRSAKYRNPETLALLEKIRNIPLGIVDRKYAALKKQRTPEKDIDIFWSGQLSSTVREKVSKHLQASVVRKVWNIFIPTQRLSFEEYCRTVARSKLTISVEGDGWDCFRHYEAVALGSVPLINKPTVDSVWWHRMPGAIYFDNDFSNFDIQVEQLLRSDELRTRCFREMEQNIEQNMLWSKIIEYIIHTSTQHMKKLHGERKL